MTVQGPGSLAVSGNTTVADGAKLAFVNNPTHVQQSTGGLTIAPTGLVDLGNSSLIVQAERQVRLLRR